MAIIRISCPITWHEQCKWVEEHCKGYVDNTTWAAWQIGLDDIYFAVDDADAIIFKFIWGNKNNSVAV